MKLNENLLMEDDERYNLEIGSIYYKAYYMDECAEETIDVIGRFRTIEDLNAYCQVWCYENIDDYEQAIKIVTYQVVETNDGNYPDGKKRIKINSEIVWFSCISDED